MNALLKNGHYINGGEGTSVDSFVATTKDWSPNGSPIMQVLEPNSESLHGDQCAGRNVDVGPPGLDIVPLLKDKAIFITGATGFLAKGNYESGLNSFLTTTKCDTHIPFLAKTRVLRFT